MSISDELRRIGAEPGNERFLAAAFLWLRNHFDVAGPHSELKTKVVSAADRILTFVGEPSTIEYRQFIEKLHSDLKPPFMSQTTYGLVGAYSPETTREKYHQEYWGGVSNETYEPKVHRVLLANMGARNLRTLCGKTGHVDNVVDRTGVWSMISNKGARPVKVVSEGDIKEITCGACKTAFTRLAGGK